MSIAWDSNRKAYRFYFRQKIGGQQCNFTKLLARGITKAQADSHDRKETARLYTEYAGLDAGKGVTIATCVDLYVKHHLPSLKTAAATARELIVIVDDIGETLLSDVGPWSREMAKLAAERKWMPATLMNRLAYVRAAINYACAMHADEVGEDQGYGKRMTKPVVNNKKDLFLDYEAQLPALLKAQRDDHMRALVMFMAYTGMRWISEILQIKEVRANGDLFVDDTKNGTKLLIPMHPALEPWKHHVPFDQLSPRNYQKLFKAAAKRAGLGWLNPHMLRHSVAARILSSGGTLTEVAEVLNHKSLSSSFRYKHLSTTAKRAALARV